MKRHSKQADKVFKQIQLEFRQNLRNSMMDLADHHEKTTKLGMPTGMGESLFFTLMWDEFTSIYKDMLPTEWEENEEFLKHLFEKIMNGDSPGASLVQEKPTIN